MLRQLFKSKPKAASVDADSLSYLSTGYSIIPASSPLVVTGIWQRYRAGASTDKDLLQDLSRCVAELKVPHAVMPGKFRMATHLAYASCGTKQQTADAIDGLIDWADDNSITVLDGTST